MSLPFSRNVVIPVSFVAFAIALFLAPAVNVVFSLFLLAMGLALSTMVYVLWPEPPVAGGARGAEPRYRPTRVNRQQVNPAPSTTSILP